MIALDSALPETIEVEGRAFPIDTDFRDWINFDRLIFDASVPSDDKVLLFLKWYSGDVPRDLDAAVLALLEFYMCGDQLPEQKGPAPGKPPKRIADLTHDAPFILASFRQAYGIDLMRVDLHWWEFKTLLDNLPDESKYQQILGYRALDMRKVPKDQRERYRKLKALYALPGDKKPSISLDERNRKWLEYAGQINASAHAASAMDSLPILP